ncbi:MAG TPA: PAS domain-containing protein, partial [Gallionella sp.]|nr:PAS domain-containing protein [Gallionella sp.]
MPEIAITAGRNPLPLEYLDRYCQNRHLSFAGSLLLSLLIGAALWPLVAHDALLGWVLSLWLVQAGHAIYARRYVRMRAAGPVEYASWMRGFLIGALVTGVCWSLPFFLLSVSNFDPAAVLLIFAIAGVTAYAGVTMAVVLPVAIAFELAALLPMCAWLFMQDERMHFFMGIATLLYLGMLYVLLRQISGEAAKAYVLGAENRELADGQRESELRMARYFEHAPGFFFTLIRQPNGRVAMPFASAGIVELYGLQPQDVMASVAPIIALDHPDDVERIMQEMTRSATTLTPCQVEFRVRHPQKGELWVEARSIPEQEAGGAIRFNGFMHEITGRKHLEEELVAREHDYRSLAKNMPDNVARWDLEGRYLYVNPTHERLLGIPASELIGTPIPDSHEQVKAAIAQVAATGQVVKFVRQAIVIDGEMQIHDVNLIPEYDADGKIVSVMGIGRDMTAIYRLQDTLAAREQEFRSLAESLPVAVIRYDGECKRRYLNPAAEKMLHGSAAELLGQVPGGSCVPATPAMIEHYRGKMEEVLVTGAEREFDFVLDALSAERQEHFEVRFVPEQGADGKTTGVLAIWYDVTGREAMEKVLRDSERMLQEAQRIAHVGSWDVDMVNDKLTWSDEIFRIWEIDKAQFKANFAAFLETVHPEDRARVVQAYDGAVVNHTLYEVEHRLLFADGRVKHILERGEPQYDAQG